MPRRSGRWPNRSSGGVAVDPDGRGLRTLPRGRGGRVYAVAPLLQSLVHLPGAWGRWALGKVAPASAPHSMPFFSHLAPAALGGGAVPDLLAARRGPGGAAGGGAVHRDAGALDLRLGLRALALFGDPAGRCVFCCSSGPCCGRGLRAGHGGAPCARRGGGRPARQQADLRGGGGGGRLAAGCSTRLAWPGGRAARPLRTGAGAKRARCRRLRARGAAAAEQALRFFGWVAAGAAPFVLLVLGYNYLRWGSLLRGGVRAGTGAGGGAGAAVRREHPGRAVGDVPVAGQELLSVQRAPPGGAAGAAPPVPEGAGGGGGAWG